MKALQITAPKTVQVVEIPEPQPAPGQFVLQVQMVGMCGSDLNTYLGKNPMVTYPRILGHEIAARIVECPTEHAETNSAHFRIGSNVTVSPYTACGVCPACQRGRPNACQYNQTFGVQRDGAMTELICVPGEKLYSAETLGTKELAMVEPLTIGFHAVSRGRVTSSDTVGIIGCGGVGMGAIIAASGRGATVIAIDVDHHKLTLAKAAGASYAIHSGENDLHAALGELTNGRGPDVIIEAIGLPATFRTAVEEVAFTGRVVYIGYAKEPVSYETRLFVQKELDILGSRNATEEDFRQVIQTLQQEKLPIDQFISAVVPLTDAGNALREWSESPARFQKILVNISND